MSGIDSIYLKSPVWAQQLGVAAYGWWWYRRRFSSHFDRALADLREREHWTAPQFAAFQRERLAEVLKSAMRAPHYGRVLQVPATIGDDLSGTLRSLPFLSKQELRQESTALLTTSRLPRGTVVFRSSGTTGTPSELYYTPEFHALQLAAFQARNLSWAGIQHGERRVMFGVRKVCAFDQAKPPFWRFSPVENMAYASVYHLSPRFLPSYVAFLRRYKPSTIMGYPSALHTVARYALEHNDLPAPANAVFTTSETVTPRAREAIEAAWQCRVCEAYGAVEACVFASHCEYGRYHVSPDMGMVEILDKSGQPVQPGVMGEVVCTGLHNLVQPLIRYRLGDVARWAVNQSCQCGREMPILEAIDGRVEDLCYTADGREMLRFDTVFKGVQHISEAQVVQRRLDVFTVRVVPCDGFGEHDAALIERNLRLHVGPVKVDVARVEAIPRSDSGKFRAVICELPPEDRARLGHGLHQPVA